MTSSPPIPFAQLEQIVVKACQLTVGDIREYESKEVLAWNTAIIQTILKSLDESAPPSTKFIVHSIVSKHVAPESSTSGHMPTPMHAAIGAKWDASQDGSWIYKVDGEEHGRLFDVIVTVIWLKS